MNSLAERPLQVKAQSTASSQLRVFVPSPSRKPLSVDGSFRAGRQREFPGHERRRTRQSAMTAHHPQLSFATSATRRPHRLRCRLALKPLVRLQLRLSARSRTGPWPGRGAAALRAVLERAGSRSTLAAKALRGICSGLAIFHPLNPSFPGGGSESDRRPGGTQPHRPRRAPVAAWSPLRLGSRVCVVLRTPPPGNDDLK